MVTIANAIYDSVFKDELESWNATEMKLREQLQEKDSQLQEKDAQIISSIKMMNSFGVPVEKIAENFKMDVDEVKQIITTE
ncbi:MAG: hypothetical protein IIU03_09140 [Bacteroidales bacterium]|nr:hypothetical protein [Bacteroidales bacterium]